MIPAIQVRRADRNGDEVSFQIREYTVDNNNKFQLVSGSERFYTLPPMMIKDVDIVTRDHMGRTLYHVHFHEFQKRIGIKPNLVTEIKKWQTELHRQSVLISSVKRITNAIMDLDIDDE